MANNSIMIGGVKFNKADIQSSTKVEKNGKEYNSIFLNNGTKVEFPNQPADNKSSISCEKMNDKVDVFSAGIVAGDDVLSSATYAMKNQGKKDLAEKLAEGIVNKDAKAILKDDKGNYVSVERLDDAEITGTENQDLIALKGCTNTKVNLTQDDKKADKVVISNSSLNGSIFKSSNNTVNANSNDIFSDKTK